MYYMELVISFFSIPFFAYLTSIAFISFLGELLSSPTVSLATQTPLMLENGEDIHLSATCQILGGIKSVVPVQNSKDLCGNLKPSYGFDRHASFLHKKEFFNQRQKIQEYLISQKK